MTPCCEPLRRDGRSTLGTPQSAVADGVGNTHAFFSSLLCQDQDVLATLA
jgi:hypothetical protein